MTPSGKLFSRNTGRCRMEVQVPGEAREVT